MAKHRINVLGASGSGATTVGRALATALSIPHFDSDDYYHAPSDPPFQKPRDTGERDRMIARDLQPDKEWVLSGGVAGWEPCPELRFTGIVFLYVETEARLERLRRREAARFGDRIRQGGDMHRAHEEFLAWASRYDAGDVEGKTLPRYEAWLKTVSCPVIEFRGEKALEEIVQKILAWLKCAE